MSFVTFSVSAEQVIVMEKSGGVYKIPATVNGAKMKFIFDTGASVVSLSLSAAEYLLENDFISVSDFIRRGQSTTADGSIVDHMELNIRKIVIGDNIELINVPAIVIASQNAPLLLGQSAIQKLGSCRIEGNKLIIDNAESSLDKMDFADIANMADEHSEFRRYSEAASLYEYLYKQDGLTGLGLFNYGFNLYMDGQYESAIKIFKEIKAKGYFSTCTDKLTYDQHYNPDSFISSCYFGLNNTAPATFFADKAIEFVNDNRLKYSISYCTGSQLYEMSQYAEAANYYWKSFIYSCDEKGNLATETYSYIIGERGSLNGSLTSSMLDSCFAFIEAKGQECAWKWEDCDILIKRIAKLGGRAASIYCNQNNIAY